MKWKALMTILISGLLTSCYDPPIMNMFVGTYPTCHRIRSYAPHETSFSDNSPTCTYVRRCYRDRFGRLRQEVYGDASTAANGYGNAVPLYRQTLNCCY